MKFFKIISTEEEHIKKLDRILQPTDPSVHPRFLRDRIKENQLYVTLNVLGRYDFSETPFEGLEEVTFEEYFKDGITKR